MPVVFGLPCQYSPKVERSPLTRASVSWIQLQNRSNGCSYLTSVEKRLQKLQDVLGELLPKADLDAILASPGDETDHSGPSPSISDQTLIQEAKGAENCNIVVPETLPHSLTGYDWSESMMTSPSKTDGMAILSVEPRGTGYLGRSSV